MSKLNKVKKVDPNPEINKIVQHRYSEKNFLTKKNIKTTEFERIVNESDIKKNKNLLPGILKTSTLGYDGKGQYPINSIDELNSLNIDFSKGYILEKLVKLKKEISII